MIGSMVAVWYAFYRISREDMALVREDMNRVREETNRRDAEARQEFAKKNALWADLLQKIHDIKCDQPKKSNQN